MRQGVRPSLLPSGGLLRPALLCLAGALVPVAGCHHASTTAHAPAPPAVRAGHNRPAEVDGAFFDDTHVRPNFTETGQATWYYAHGHRGADGLAYAAATPTAAHKTLPLGSTVRVTNLATGQSTYVRITDRGPFYPGRILDLSEVAAKQIGLYHMGIAEVRLEAFPHPQADPLGRWCVQTGPFRTAGDASDLKSALLARYRGARVAEFPGQTGFWVRIDPVTRGRTEAATIADWIGAPDADANSFVVRLN